MRVAYLLTWFLVVCVTVSGCGKSDGRVEVKGVVTVNGDPLAFGNITLLPLEGQETNSGGVIENGAFQIAAADGPKPGNYKVEIRWPKLTGRTIPQSPEADETKETMEGLPPQYNTKSTLTTTFVPGTNTLEYDLKVSR